MHLLSDTCNLLSLGSKSYSKCVIVKNSKLSFQCLKKVYELGFISGFTILDKKKIKVYLKYNQLEPTLRTIYTVSVPSKAFFVKKKKIQNISKGSLNGFLIISSDCGLISDIECTLFSKGGKVLIGLN